MITVEPPNNGQVGAGGFVLYSEVSFIGRLYHNYMVNVTSTVFNEAIMTSNAQDELNQYTCIAMVFESRLTPQIDIVGKCK